MSYAIKTLLRIGLGSLLIAAALTNWGAVMRDWRQYHAHHFTMPVAHWDWG